MAMTPASDDSNALATSAEHSVDLREAAGPRLQLTNTELRWANGSGAQMKGVQARNSFIEYVSFRRADLRDADFSQATLRHCAFNESLVDGADFTDARLSHCSFDGASLRGCQFHGAVTVDCSFTDAVLEGAREFATARDLVVEILRRGCADDLQALEVVGAVALRRAWCWEHWTAYLLDRPRLLHLAATIFNAYPESGCAEALATPPEPATDQASTSDVRA
jgi:uncharacterized protein YjbI with pentapeptide repeats